MTASFFSSVSDASILIQRTLEAKLFSRWELFTGLLLKK